MLLRFFLLCLLFSNIAYSKSAQIVSAGTIIGKVPDSFCQDKTFASFKLFTAGSKFVYLNFQKKQDSTELIFDDVGLTYQNDNDFIQGFCDEKELKIKPKALSAILRRIKSALPACSILVQEKKGLVCKPKNYNTPLKKN